MSMASASEFVLGGAADGPTDGISRVRFAPGPKRFLLASSWDTGVRLYDCTANALVNRFSHVAPVLDCAFGPDLTSVSGGLDKQVKWYDWSADDEARVLGQHDEAVRCVEYAQTLGLAVTGSWDATVRTWDFRASAPKEVGRVASSSKVFAMSLGGDWRVTVGSADRRVEVFDLRKFSVTSPLKHQTRVLATFQDNQAWAVGTVDGRAAIEVFADAKTSAPLKSFSFKCHRSKGGKDGGDVVHPVNALAVHPRYGTLVSGGGDGLVVVWDPLHQKRLCQYHQYATSISSVDFSPDGALLAIAVSYTFEQGDQVHPPDRIHIRTVKDSEVKAAAAAAKKK